MLRNLMPVADGPAVLDFQDAMRGPIAYDVLSLCRDAFASWPEARVARWRRLSHARRGRRPAGARYRVLRARLRPGWRAAPPQGAGHICAAAPSRRQAALPRRRPELPRLSRRRDAALPPTRPAAIGRASCRESVCQYV